MMTDDPKKWGKVRRAIYEGIVKYNRALLSGSAMGWDVTYIYQELKDKGLVSEEDIPEDTTNNIVHTV